MPVWETIRHQAAIAGRITEKLKDTPLAGVSVRIRSATAEAVTVTKPNGCYHVLDLPDGDYEVTASLPREGSRYGTTQTTATVSRTPEGKIVMATADLSLPPTTIKGSVTASGGTAVFMAEVRVQGSGERAFTGQDGGYRITGVERGRRDLLISARGFKPASCTVQLDQAGEVATADVTLTSS